MKILRSSVIAVICLLVLWPVLYTIRNFGVSDYRLAFMSSLAATVVGLVAGIPVGLEINRRQSVAQATRDELERAAEMAHRRNRILGLIGKELEFNENLISKRSEENAGVKQRIVSLPMLKQDVWDAFSDGGELQWVRDPNLLDSLAEAYYHIRGIAFLEERYFDAVHFSGVRTSNQGPEILKYLANTDQPAVGAIRAAVAAVERSLQPDLINSAA